MRGLVGTRTAKPFGGARCPYAHAIARGPSPATTLLWATPSPRLPSSVDPSTQQPWALPTFSPLSIFPVPVPQVYNSPPPYTVPHPAGFAISVLAMLLSATARAQG